MKKDIILKPHNYYSISPLRNQEDIVNINLYSKCLNCKHLFLV